eukprot:TRINITY_DN54921_c0_g1_i1.p1 TRINITY_DN54921_c0_g1~~TRINITY_DN54921_c0_g1_i1.p1  ORF type:complete len:329 (-),score=53.15 TRINITY_DN54921_c0_g1_i1:77-1030(-)
MAGTPIPLDKVQPRRITRALLSAASRPTALDTRTRPKALIDIEGTSLIIHVLRQLYRGGIVHVVLVVSHHGVAIIEELKHCRSSLPGLHIEAVDLGEDWGGFYAASLLASSNRFPVEAEEPGLLIATADHIFDEGLVADICTAELSPGSTDVCVLVDFSGRPHTGLPPTSVGVRCNRENMRVSELSRELGRPMVQGAPCSEGVGIEAGLFSCTSAIFDRLQALAETTEYFTITDAVQELAALGLVSTLATGGRKWVAVETTEELEESRNSHMIQRSGSPSSEASPADSSPCFDHEPIPVFFIAGGATPCSSRVPSKK